MEIKSAAAGSVKEKIRALRITAAALTAGVFIFSFISVIICQINGPVLADKLDKYRSFLLPILTGLALIATLLARYLYQQRLRGIREGNDNLEVKVDIYRSSVILYLAICEGTAILSVILFLFSGDYPILFVTGAMLLLMLGKLYSMKGLAAELNLDWNEQEALK